jgi:uncharacterized protein (DUF433 family)
MTKDIREIPSYTPSEVAYYLRVPKNTVMHWLIGYPYQTNSGPAYSKPLIKIACKEPYLLSFFNLVEVHVLSALRRTHKIPMDRVRKALDYLGKFYSSPHPLVDNWFQTDGIHIFTSKVGKLECISQPGQLAMRELLERYLHRIDWDEKKLALRLYPYTTKTPTDEIRLIVIDPAICFGRPVIKGSGIPTSIIAERWEAGESPEDLVNDYGRTAQEIQEALRCELRSSAA